MWDSESLRMLTAREAKFRVQYPNSKPRAVKMIAIDEASAQLVDEISRLTWNGAEFFNASSFGEVAEDAVAQSGARSPRDSPLSLFDKLADADSVVVVTSVGADPQAAGLIAAACREYRIPLIVLVVPRPGGGTEAELETSLRSLRPHAHMLVIAEDLSYVEAMLTALRA
jgi:hypothetical protein